MTSEVRFQRLTPVPVEVDYRTDVALIHEGNEVANVLYGPIVAIPRVAKEVALAAQMVMNVDNGHPAEEFRERGPEELVWAGTPAAAGCSNLGGYAGRCSRAPCAPPPLIA